MNRRKRSRLGLLAQNRGHRRASCNERFPCRDRKHGERASSQWNNCFEPQWHMPAADPCKSSRGVRAGAHGGSDSGHGSPYPRRHRSCCKGARRRELHLTDGREHGNGSQIRRHPASSEPIVQPLSGACLATLDGANPTAKQPRRLDVRPALQVA